MEETYDPHAPRSNLRAAAQGEAAALLAEQWILGYPAAAA